MAHALCSTWRVKSTSAARREIDAQKKFISFFKVGTEARDERTRDRLETGAGAKAADNSVDDLSEVIAGFHRFRTHMATLPQSSENSPGWSTKAKEMAAEAKVLSGNKLEQLVIRIQRHTGRPKETCWRFVIQYGIKGKPDYRRWTDPEFDLVREELVKGTVEHAAKKLNRTPKAIRNMLRRNHLSLRDIRCDLFSVESLATVLRVRKSEIVHWIEQGWLEATVGTRGKRHFYIITPEALIKLYKQHQADLLKRGIRNQALFEAYLQYCYSPKHTVGEQLLDVRRDKRERAAFAAAEAAGSHRGEDEEENDDDDEGPTLSDLADEDETAED